MKNASIDAVRTLLEKVMMELPASKTKAEHQMYLAGMIDSLFEQNIVSENDREILYLEFCYFVQEGG